MNAVITQLAYHLPDTIVSNADLRSEHPEWDLDRVEKKSGVMARRIALPGETALDLSIKACEKLFEHVDKAAIDGIIYCTQSPDYIMPSNAFLLQRHFALPKQAFAYDFNHACTGYIYGLMMAQAFIRSGIAKCILLVNADTYSKYINPGDRSTRVLFGDGAAASLIQPGEGNMEVIDLELATYGDGFDKFIIPAGGARMPKSDATAVETTDPAGNTRSLNDIKMDGFSVWSFINSKVPGQIKTLLGRNHLQVSDIDLFIFHQASLLTLDSLIKILRLTPEQCFINIQDIGNTVSASIPIALKDAMDAGRISKGQKIILSGFGVGLSYGAVLIHT